MILVYINGYFPYNQHYIMNCNYLNDSIKETYRTVQTNFNQQFFIENYFESNSNITIIEQIFELKYNINFNDNDRIILNYGKLNCISFVIQHFVLSNEEDILLYLSSQLTNEDQACILSNLLKLVDEIISVYYLNISNETESNEIESFQHQLSQTLLILISFYQKYKVGRWEQIFLSYIVNGGYFTYQLIIKVWNIVYSGLNESVQLDHFKALTHLVILSIFYIYTYTYTYIYITLFFSYVYIWIMK
ncbi:hypothetical protein K502DRAFT_208361 [Neoconidiobolus thromboides FSU 785]|nr:hypothetical protein K502DRAFT_208361 [Neoconidiobolus thromboides FSU 785]